MFAGQVITGSSLSITMTVKEQVVLLPEPSVLLNETVVMPLGKAEPLTGPAVCTRVGTSQLSLVTTGVQVTTAVQRPGLVLAMMF